MWLIKLPFKILALPVMLILGSLSIFYNLFLHVGSFVLGLAYIVLGLCIVSAIFISHSVFAVVVVVLTGAVIFLGLMFAEAVSLGLEALIGKLSGFIFS